MARYPMKFTFEVSVDEEYTEFTATSIEEARTFARDLLWENIGLCLTHIKSNGEKEFIDLPME